MARKKYYKYNDKDKKKALNLKKKGYSYREISEELQFPKSTILSWFKNGFENNRNKSGRKKIIDDKKVLDYIKAVRDIKLPINGDDLKQFAKNEFQKLNDQVKNLKPFKASNGWLYGFNKRNKISSRRISLSNNEPNENDIKQFFINLNSQVFELHKVWNMDQVPVNFETPPISTLDFKGKKSIQIKTNGGTKMRLSLILTCN